MSKQVIASDVTTVVAGLGETGLSCARYLSAKGKKVVVVDTRPQPPALEQLQAELPGVPVFAGEIPAAIIEGATEMVVSPGIAPDATLVESARQAGVAIVGDIDLFVRAARAPVVGITGSNAKSTVTAWVGQMAISAGINCGVGGNLGPPALSVLADDCELYVLELSSFQLERAGELGLSVATVLNVSPDHLDRHGSLPVYHQAKHRIFRGCQRAVVNLDDPLTQPLVPASVEVIGYRMGQPGRHEFGIGTIEGRQYLYHGTHQLIAVEEIGLAGRHNISNALAALALGFAAKLPMTVMLDSLRSFSGLPHRCATIASVQGVCFIDDSKATNPAATAAALDGLATGRNIVLIAGGRNKGADLGELALPVGRTCKQVILIGEAAGDMHSAFADVVDCQLAQSMAEAVTMARAVAQANDIVLLSPACASFDMFDSFVDRGRQFASQVLSQTGEEGR